MMRSRDAEGQGRNFTWPASTYEADDPLTAIHRPPAVRTLPARLQRRNAALGVCLFHRLARLGVILGVTPQAKPAVIQ